VTTPKISVCLPTYNRAGYLAQALASVLAQTFQDYEVIVSDNCSQDHTGDVVRAVTDPRVRYVRNETNIGLFGNMNQCLELARGEYVCILPDDDLYAPTLLERESAILDRHAQVGFVHAAAYQIDSAGAGLSLVRSYPSDCVLDGDQEFVGYLKGHNVWFPTAMVRRSLYRQVGAFDPSFLCSDFLMWLRLSLHGDVAYIAEPLAGIRVHASTISSNISPQRWCDEFFAIVEQGFLLAEAQRPGLITSRGEVMRTAVQTQGKRFFVAALAALTAGDTVSADGYLAVVRDLERKGLSRKYGVAASALRTSAGLRLLTLTRQLRRAWKTSRLEGDGAWLADVRNSQQVRIG
jgi:cellulose synthase/poly-beta-1,6-N-acetylglucosamine synthase-like glycosyltransferase